MLLYFSMLKRVSSLQAVLTRLSSMKNEAFSRQVSAVDDVPTLGLGPSSASWVC